MLAALQKMQTAFAKMDVRVIRTNEGLPRIEYDYAGNIIYFHRFKFSKRRKILLTEVNCRKKRHIWLAEKKPLRQPILMNPEESSEVTSDTYSDSEEPKRVIIDGNYGNDLIERLDKTIQQVWREQGFTAEDIASWNETERLDRVRKALPLIKPGSH